MGFVDTPPQLCAPGPSCLGTPNGVSTEVRHGDASHGKAAGALPGLLGLFWTAKFSGAW